MSKRILFTVKAIAHVLCLLPFFWLLQQYRSGALGLEPDPINSITHFTGDWALWILLATLAITPLRRISTHLSWLVRLRRLIGLYAFFYASLHLATYLFLFSGYDVVAVVQGIREGRLSIIFDKGLEVWPFIWDDILKRKFVQVGFFAWLLLLALAVTSPAAIMRAIGGKRWQRLHRLIYVAAAAAVVHYWWMVKTGVLTPWKVTLVLVVLLSARIAYVLRRDLSRARQERRFAE
jgi:sulfoxide reductase heme-binding subunit YedZ